MLRLCHTYMPQGQDLDVSDVGFMVLTEALHSSLGQMVPCGSQDHLTQSFLNGALLYWGLTLSPTRNIVVFGFDTILKRPEPTIHMILSTLTEVSWL